MQPTDMPRLLQGAAASPPVPLNPSWNISVLRATAKHAFSFLNHCAQEAQSLGLRPLWSLSAWAVLVDVLATSRWLLLVLTVALLALFAHVDSAQKGAKNARSWLLSYAGLCAVILGAVELAHVPLTGPDGLVVVPSWHDNQDGTGGTYSFSSYDGATAVRTPYSVATESSSQVDGTGPLGIEHLGLGGSAQGSTSSGTASGPPAGHPKMLGSLLMPATF